MFRLIEPSTGQNHSTGTFSDCTQSLNVPVLWFWPVDGSMSRNLSPNF